MKLFVLALVLANLMYVAWHAWITPPPARPAPPETEDVPTLVLADERPSASMAPPLVATLRPDVSAYRCYALGPFSARAEAEGALASLNMDLRSAAVRAETTEVPDGYWVLLAPDGDRNAARRRVQALRERGVQDLYIIPGGPMRNGISLGMFSGPQRARDRVREIEQLGYIPLLREQNRDAEAWWVDLELASGTQPDLGLLEEPSGLILRLETRQCAGGAGSVAESATDAGPGPDGAAGPDTDS